MKVHGFRIHKINIVLHELIFSIVKILNEVRRKETYYHGSFEILSVTKYFQMIHGNTSNTKLEADFISNYRDDDRVFYISATNSKRDFRFVNDEVHTC